MKQREVELWQKMADMTHEKCVKTCRSIGQCCRPDYCEMAAANMREAGHPFPLMPFGKTFVVDGKCIVPPHFRPLCSLQQCKISGLGCDPKDMEWTEAYFELRDELAMTIMESEPDLTDDDKTRQ